MKFFFCLLLALFQVGKTDAQPTPASIDSTLTRLGSWNSRLGKIAIGPKGDETVFFYFKKDKKLFAVVERRYRPTGIPGDSARSSGFFFLDDKLVAMNFLVFPRRKGGGETRLYFYNDALIHQKGPRYFPENEVKDLISKARQFFSEGNVRIRQKFKDQ